MHGHGQRNGEPSKDDGLLTAEHVRVRHDPEKSQNGLTSEVKGLIAKFGGSKLSDIDPSNYEAIIKEAEVLGNE